MLKGNHPSMNWQEFLNFGEFHWPSQAVHDPYREESDVVGTHVIKPCPVFECLFAA